MPKPRSIATTIDKIIDALPPTYHELITELVSIKSSSHFTAPELMRDRWLELATTLETHLGIPTTPETIKVQDILLDRVTIQVTLTIPEKLWRAYQEESPSIISQLSSLGVLTINEL